ncbi:hypothetical protein [Terracoccus sp. 273MFTsu3.1]|uniref:hypothetical protein n=1 Tax=Terracoccus sp. 273MFTsu3.1 TaxID=1172188 RepID=UPI00036E4032|nr:hypothetical protein [Terracoccus sp. 273MFTsu3.1]
MDDTVTSEAQSGTPDRFGQPGQRGPDSPLAVERPLGRPVSVGLVLLLVVANTIGWLWFVNHQDEQLQMLQSQVDTVDVSAPPVEPDPTLCWLVGAEARAAGHAKELVSEVTTSGTVDTCIENVIRGANGYGR